MARLSCGSKLESVSAGRGEGELAVLIRPLSLLRLTSLQACNELDIMHSRGGKAGEPLVCQRNITSKCFIMRAKSWPTMAYLTAQYL